MNQPWIYMCSPFRSPLLPPSPSQPSGSSQCTSPEHLSHASNLGCPCDFTSKNSKVGSHFLLQRILPTQGSNLCLWHLLSWQVGSLPLHYLGSPGVSGCCVKALVSTSLGGDDGNMVNLVLTSDQKWAVLAPAKGCHVKMWNWGLHVF